MDAVNIDAVNMDEGQELTSEIEAARAQLRAAGAQLVPGPFELTGRRAQLWRIGTTLVILDLTRASLQLTGAARTRPVRLRRLRPQDAGAWVRSRIDDAPERAQIPPKEYCYRGAGAARQVATRQPDGRTGTRSVRGLCPHWSIDVNVPGPNGYGRGRCLLTGHEDEATGLIWDMIQPASCPGPSAAAEHGSSPAPDA